MTEFKDRLEQALKLRDMKPADLARLTGIGEGAISQYRKGAYKATQRNLEKISKVLAVSIPWLMGAEDEEGPAPVSESGPSDPIIAQIMDVVCQMSPEERRLYLENLKTLRLLQEQGRKPDIQE